MQLTRRHALAGLGAGVSTIALAGCAPELAALPAPSARSDAAAALLDQVAWNLIEHEPGTATWLGIDVGEKAYLRGRTGDASRAGLVKLAVTLESDLASVRAFDKQGLDAANLTSLEVVESSYASALEGMALPYGDIAVGSWRNAPYVVIQNVGAYLDVPRFLTTDQPVRTKEDAEAYLSRLEGFAATLDGELERMEAASRLGVTPPSFLLDKAIPQLESTLADARLGSSLVSALTEKTAAANIPGDWENAASRIVTKQIAPALERQIRELRAQRFRATRDAGMWAQPEGDAWYSWALKASTTTSLSADEIHEMGKEELAELHGRMDPILRSLGYTQGSVGERMAGLLDDSRFKFAEGDPGRAEIMEFIQHRIDWIRAQMPRAFRTLVDGNIEVRRLPLSEEPGAPAAYGGSGSIDGSIPGRMWINLHTTDLHRKYDLPTLVHHETIPGHVWEGEYSLRLPLIRSRLAFNAFSEGWALYAEQLADELGAYDDDHVGRLGYLQSLAFRACRLVVDTGLHAKRWTREQAIEWFHTANGNSLAEITPEVERYCSWPAQACGYKVGHSEMVRQRSRAQEALGSAYDIRDFNDAVVKGGNVPLDVLAKNVDRYIAAAMG